MKIADDFVASWHSAAVNSDGKKRWVPPKLLNMDPGSAEFGSGNKGDGAGGGSIHS